RPVDRARASRALSGEEGDPARLIAERQRKAPLRRAAERGSDSGNHDNRDAGLAQILQLFAAAPEYERIAAFEPHHAATGARRPDQAAVDLVLCDARLAAPLANEYLLGAASRSLDHSPGHHLVVEHHIAVREGLERTQGH